MAKQKPKADNPMFLRPGEVESDAPITAEEVMSRYKYPADEAEFIAAIMNGDTDGDLVYEKPKPESA